MMAAIVDSMANAFVFNMKVSDELNTMKDTINGLKADIESIRRAIGIGSDTDTDAEKDTKPASGLKLVN
jgi:hypothetical protein